MLPLVLFLFASVTRVHVVDEPFDIPAREWRFPDAQLELHQRAATLVADYQVESGSPIRLLLMTREDVERMNDGKPHGSLMTIGPAAYGSMQFAIPEPGDYALVLDNRNNDRPARIHLSVWLDFPAASGISTARQLTVILLSFAFFFGVVAWSARKLWKGIYAGK